MSNAPESACETWIVDGIWGWHTRWERLRRKIERRIGVAHIWRYPSMGFLPLDILGRRLAEDLAKCENPLHLIGYSMGGLIVREALRLRPDLAVRHVVLIHSPHEGSRMARFLPLAAVRQMRPNSEFLTRLNAGEWTYSTMVTWCPGDLMVVPGRSAKWDKARKVLRSAVPLHEWPVISPGIHRAIIDFLAEKVEQ